MIENIETKATNAILQAIEDVVVGDTTYRVAPPSTATLILVSEAVARMPQVNIRTENIIDESLAIAKHCAVEGEIVAIMTLGAKGLTEVVTVYDTIEKEVTKQVQKTIYDEYLFGLIKKPRIVTEEVVEIVTETIERSEEIDHKSILTKKLLEDIPPKELSTLTARLLQKMQISDFFAITTFLIEINLLRQTKEVVKETTASGQ